MAINWADQGKYVGNPNHGGGGMMSGSTKDGLSNSMPSWVTAPNPGGAYMTALSELTNPTTGETWTAPHGGYTINNNTANPSPLTGPDGRFIDLPTTQPLGGVQQVQKPWGGGSMDIEPVWADSFDWNTATLADAHRKLSTDKYGMVNYAKYSDADAQRLLDGERSSMASTQQPAPGFNMSPAVQPMPTADWSGFAPQQPVQSTPTTDAPTLSTPIWGAPSYYRPGQNNQNQYNNLSASSQPWWWDQSNGSRPGTAPTAPIGGGTGGNTGDGGSDSFPGEGGSSGDGYSPSYADYGDYYGGYGRDIAAGIGGLFGLPLEHLADYAMGYSPLTGSFYDTYQGPGSEFIDSYGIDPSTEQGQMLLEQEFLTEVPGEESIFGNLFGANEPQYIVDPDTFLFQNKEAEEAWHNAVSDQDMAEADAIDAAGWGSDEHFDAIDKAFSDLPEAPTAPTAPITEEYVVPDNNGTIEDISDAYTGGGFTDDAGNTYTEEAWDSYAEDVFSEMDDFEDSVDAADGPEDSWGDWGDDDDGGME
jgi:hypothetical protein